MSNFKMTNNGFIELDVNETAKNILIVGNTEGFFGNYTVSTTGIDLDSVTTNVEKVSDRILYLYNALANGTNVFVIANAATVKYYREFFTFVKKSFLKFKSSQVKFLPINTYEETYNHEYNLLVKAGKSKDSADKSAMSKAVKAEAEAYMETVKKIIEKGMKFDYIIENPPYAGSFHLDFLKESLKMLDEKGKFTIIEPATWLINIRKNGKASLYDEIKKKLEGHVSKVVIENYNKEFNIELYVPCSVTYVDMSKTYDEIMVECCGEAKVVKSLYDCNLVGNYDMIWSIINKVQKYGDMMKSHIYKAEGRNKSVVDENTWYTKYPEIFGGCGASFCGTTSTRNGANYESDNIYLVLPNKSQYITPYLSACYHYNSNNISKTLVCKNDKANNLTDKPADNLYDTKDHLENWKHFVFNNKLPLFLNICLTIDQNNNSKEFIPWLVDKKYTDVEINELFMFTPDEITFIDKTLKKFERHSPWFKRYMCGKDSASSEEIQKFIDSL